MRKLNYIDIFSTLHIILIKPLIFLMCPPLL